MNDHTTYMTTQDRHNEEGRALLEDGLVCPHGRPQGVSNYDVWFCGACERAAENDYHEEHDMDARRPRARRIITERTTATATVFTSQGDDHLFVVQVAQESPLVFQVVGESRNPDPDYEAGEEGIETIIVGQALSLAEAEALGQDWVSAQRRAERVAYHLDRARRNGMSPDALIEEYAEREADAYIERRREEAHLALAREQRTWEY